MPDNEKRVAIIFDNLVQFFCMQKGIDALIAANIAIDLIIPTGNEQRQPLLDETDDYLKAAGYHTIRDLAEPTQYQILLDPFEHVSKYDIFRNIKFKFRIKYRYGLATAKPRKAFAPANCLVYDAILCHSKWEADVLQAYTKTFLIAPLKFIGFTKDTHRVSTKPTLLYLPTGGQGNSIAGMEQAIQKLRNDYYVIVKAHHLTENLQKEQSKLEILQDDSDEYYDQRASLVDLLKTADVVLSDNSGAIFDAIYAEVPVAIYHESSVNLYHYGNIDTYQYRLVESGAIPYTNNIEDLGTILAEALTLADAQKAAKADFASIEDGADSFVGVIKYYLSLDKATDAYYCLRKSIRAYQTRPLTLKTRELADIKRSKSFRLGRALLAPLRVARNTLRRRPTK